MATIAGSTPTYDADGNVTNDFLHSYTWDSAGRPTIIDGVGVTTDVLGRIVELNRSGTYSQFLYAPTGFKIEIMNGSTFVKSYVPLSGSAVAVGTPSVVYFRHPDWLGSSRFASTTSRTVYYDGAYGPFGEPYAQTGTTDLSFTGMDQDTVANLYDFPTREYGIQGRWPSPDPAGLAAVDPTNPQSWNRYAYVLNNPLSYVDRTGLYCQWDDGTSDDIPANGGAGAGECGDQGGTWVPVCGVDTICSNDNGGGDSGSPNIPPARSSSINWTWWGNAAGSFFTEFSVFGGANDPRPSCVVGFGKGTVRNFFSYSGADIIGAVAAGKYVLTLPSPVPPTMALRGGKYALNWIKADNAARAANATLAGFMANLVYGEVVALGDEIDATLNGDCK
jgi:RHS repeat-associated protein